MENVIMESKTDELVDVIAKLIKLTQNGEIPWVSQPIDEALKQSPDDEIGPVFTGNYRGKTLRIYRRRYKYERGRLAPGVSGPISGALRSLLSPYAPTPGAWITEVILEMIGDQGAALWTFPSHSMLKDLLSAVQYKAAGVKEFLADVLSEE